MLLVGLLVGSMTTIHDIIYIYIFVYNIYIYIYVYIYIFVFFCQLCWQPALLAIFTFVNQKNNCK